MVYVQFSDSTETKIISSFGCPQDPIVYPNQGTIDTGDARWTAYYDSVSTFMRNGLPAPTA